MGISGLLPALKSIQVTKHLSEYKGQTIAVDAYVWLHKGVYACATELATGKPTNKYVKYAIERVRLLRYHGIEPYIVFDGGPLPAKQGTESERKRKREENISRGHMLTSQGKHSQARECYTKCVDVTPQMAFQFIKALRAEGVKYVVAPYEADAQLAFLEKTGIVSAILTEDSDLLVFGCKNVLFKLDTVARTVVSISTDNFASVTDSNSISLLGWSAKQFREMAILSGCDYLPSIPGVGLKTACTLLRKWKTPEQVVRAIALEGKKKIPKGYLTQFRLADKCFLYQRVYHPGLERLVHLNDLPSDEEWDEVVDACVGSDMDPSLAKAIAVGEKDPVSRLAMVDINPGFAPSSRVLQEVPIATKQLNRSQNGKGKGRDRPNSEGILSFFGPNPKIPPIPKSPSAARPKFAPKPLIAGKDSGKRTLAELHDQDLSARKKKRMIASPTKPTQTVSRFFGSSGMKKEDKRASFLGDSETPVAGPSRVHDEKENEYIVIDDESEEGVEGDSLIDSDVDLEVEVVEQEDGYMSPTSSYSRDIQDLSSPPRPSTAPMSRRTSSDAFEFGAEAVSSPPSRGRSYGRLRMPHATTAVSRSRERVLVESTPEIEVKRSGTVQMLDLKDSFGDEVHSDIDWSGDETASSPTPSPLTPDDLAGQDRDLTPSITAVEGEDLEDPEEQEQNCLSLRSAAVAAGWKNVWSFGPTGAGQGKSAFLRRSNTNVTPMGRHQLGAAETQRKSSSRAHPYLHDHAPALTSHSSASCSDGSLPTTLKARRSLVFVEETKTVKTQPHGNLDIQPARNNPMNHSTEGGYPSVSAKSRLESFRFIHR